MYKNFSLTDEERKEIMESHESHGYKKPVNERAYISKRYDEFDVVRGNPDFKTQTGRPSDEYLKNRAAALQFQQDFQKEFPDPGKEYRPHWEKDKPNSSGDNIDDSSYHDDILPYDLQPPKTTYDKLDTPNVVDEPKQIAPPKLSKKEELEALEKKITALGLYKKEFGLDAKMTHLYYELYAKHKEALRDYNRGGVK
jgi:hypothetical protein